MASKWEWPANPSLVHLVRFVVLVVGLLVGGELFVGLLGCTTVEYANPLQGLFHCADGVLFYLRFFVPLLLPFHVIPVVLVSLVATAGWAWLDRRRS